MAALRAEMDAQPGDLVAFAVADRLAPTILGGMRCHMADALSVREGHDFCGGQLRCSIGTRTARRTPPSISPSPWPDTDDLEAIIPPLAAGSCTYDFVMDGEAGGGGMRIHNAQMQPAMLEMLGQRGERLRAVWLPDGRLEFGAGCPMMGFRARPRPRLHAASHDSSARPCRFPRPALAPTLCPTLPAPSPRVSLRKSASAWSSRLSRLLYLLLGA